MNIYEITEVVQRADINQRAEISQRTAVIQDSGIEQRTEIIEMSDFVAGIVATIANRAANRIRIWRYLIAGSMGKRCQARQSQTKNTGKNPDLQGAFSVRAKVTNGDV